MIDTVNVKYSIPVKRWQRQIWIRTSCSTFRGLQWEKYKLETSIFEGATITCRYYPPNERYPEHNLALQVSLPKVLSGNNVEMITSKEEIEAAILIVKNYVGGNKWIPSVDFGEGILWRVDACCNNPVGKHVQDYLSCLSRLTYPGRTTKIWDYGSVYYLSSKKNTHHALYFYDKQMECHQKIADDILRQESAIRRTFDIERSIDIDNTTLWDVTIEWLVNRLNHDLVSLRLKDTLICNQDLSLKMLQTEYKPFRAYQLYGYLMARQQLPREEMLKTGTKLRTIQSYEKAIADAGVALTMTDKASLPPLHIKREPQQPVEILVEGMSCAESCVNV